MRGHFLSVASRSVHTQGPFSMITKAVPPRSLLPLHRVFRILFVLKSLNMLFT